METLKNQFLELSSFLHSAFHQEALSVLDWKGHVPNLRDAVQFYKLLEESKTISQIEKELENLLALSLSERDLNKLIQEFRVSYDPTYGGTTYREWLEEVLSILKDSSAKTSYLSFIQQPEYTGWEQYAE